MATLNATNYSELVTAMAAAVSGDIIFCPDDSQFNFTGNPRMTVKAGVTIEGVRGKHKVGGGKWLGARFYVTSGNASIFQMAANSKLKLIRIEGYQTETNSSTVGGGGITVTGNNVRIEWCEIFGFGDAGIRVNYTNTSWRTYVDRCLIHHCQRDGAGYGLTVNHGFPIVSNCRFYNYRHCVAGSGDINTAMEVYGCLVDTPNPAEFAHSFDMHSVDGDTPPTGRTSYLLNYHDNVFKVRNPNDGEACITVRGIPVAAPGGSGGMIYIQNNKFPYSSLGASLNLFGGETNNAYTTISGNTQSYTGPYVDPSDTDLYWGAPPVDAEVTAVMVSPSDGAMFVMPTNVFLSADATTTAVGGTITGVEFYYGAVKIGDGVLALGLWGFNWLSVTEGTYVITAKATDSTAEIGVSNPVTITVVPATEPPSENTEWVFTRHSYIFNKLSNFIKRAPWLFRG